MVQYSQAFDAAFGALSDPTRRGVLEQLGRADASITALAERFHMTLTGMRKHVGVLERAGLVRTEKVGRVRTCKLGTRGLEEEAAWIESYRQLWAARFDALDQVVEDLKRRERVEAARLERPKGRKATAGIADAFAEVRTEGPKGRKATAGIADAFAEVRTEGPKGRKTIAKGEALVPASAASVRALKGRNKDSAIVSKEKTNGN